jgi:transcriptional regulator with XRE-family HTH domain
MTSDPDIEAIRRVLTRHMAARKWSARKLARQAGLGQSAVRDLLGKVSDPRLSTIYALADALDISPLALLGVESAMDEIEQAARALADKLDEVAEASGEIFSFAFAHGVEYRGPTFVKELEALRRALKKQPQEKE